MNKETLKNILDELKKGNNYPVDTNLLIIILEIILED